MELENLMKSIEEELEDWEAAGKPNQLEYPWRWEEPVYTLYDEGQPPTGIRMDV